jgi:hypothetical protein
MPPAIPRSRAGNQIDTAFMPAGLAEPSAIPSKPRRKASICQLVARPCAMEISDHSVANMAKPNFRPITSAHSRTAAAA